LFSSALSLLSGSCHLQPSCCTGSVCLVLPSSRGGLSGLFVLISSIFAKELTSGDGSPCVLFYDAARSPSVGTGELGYDYIPLIYIFLITILISAVYG